MKSRESPISVSQYRAWTQPSNSHGRAPLELTHTEDYHGMRIGFIPVGDSSLELLEDVSGSSAIGKYLEKMAKEFTILHLR